MSDNQAVPDEGAVPLPTGAPGVFLYPDQFEAIIAGLRRGVSALASDETFRALAVPPVISRSTIERAGYVASFPHLLGTVHSFAGSTAEWTELAPLIEEGGDWHAKQRISDLVLLPAACYPTYATLVGRALDAPAKFRVEAPCFRQESTSEDGRLRTFRMLELVTAATEEHCLEWRARWLDRVAEWLTGMSLKVEIEVADDPFFGRGRKLYQSAQRAKQLKFELRVPVSGDLIQAVASANYHEDHFGVAFDFTCSGETGNTSCMAFGLERIAMALINAHGPHPDNWPSSVTSALGG